MNPDYKPNKYDRIADAYGRPLDRDRHSFDNWEYNEQQSFNEYKRVCASLVGRVITQKGFEGALVLSYGCEAGEDVFKIRLRDGKVINAFWSSYAPVNDEPGVSSEGWKVVR